jgi:hypothetical protein
VHLRSSTLYKFNNLTIHLSFISSNCEHAIFFILSENTSELVVQFSSMVEMQSSDKKAVVHPFSSTVIRYTSIRALFGPVLSSVLKAHHRKWPARYRLETLSPCSHHTGKRTPQRRGVLQIWRRIAERFSNNFAANRQQEPLKEGEGCRIFFSD